MKTQHNFGQTRELELILNELEDNIKAIEPGPLPSNVQDQFLDILSRISKKMKHSRENTIATLNLHGVNYPLSEWVTPKNYAKQFGLSTETVINWINRGVIPEENIKRIPELDLRLVKAIEYNPRKYVKSQLD